MIGKIKEISTSKIKKIILIKKKCTENGKRNNEILSNPHSKEVNLLRILLFFFLNKKFNDNNNILIKINNKFINNK